MASNPILTYVCTTHLEHVDVALALEEDSGEDEGGGIHKHQQAQSFDKLKISGKQTVNCKGLQNLVTRNGQIQKFKVSRVFIFRIAISLFLIHRNFS